jgi:predicted TIM-barrel fold metal-dependent hydrolase
MLREMDANHVDQTVVFTMGGFWGSAATGNEELNRLTRPYRDRLIPFCTIHPYDGKAALAELKRCREKFDMHGIKLHSWCQGFSVVTEAMFQVAAAAVDLSMPIVFHDGTPPYSEPLQIAHLAHLFPKLKILLGHAGLKDFYQEAILAAKRHANIYLGTNMPMSPMERVCRELNGERIVFGSDIGFGGVSQKYGLKAIEAMNLPEAVKDRILHYNALALLGGK